MAKKNKNKVPQPRNAYVESAIRKKGGPHSGKKGGKGYSRHPKHKGKEVE